MVTPLRSRPGVGHAAKGPTRRRPPQRGDVIHIRLGPTEGGELRGSRPCVVISPREFNALAGLVIACPITQGGQRARENGWAIALMGSGTKTQGMIVASQIRTLDYSARGFDFIETLPLHVLDEVLARLEPLLGFGS